MIQSSRFYKRLEHILSMDTNKSGAAVFVITCISWVFHNISKRLSQFIKAI